MAQVLFVLVVVIGGMGMDVRLLLSQASLNAQDVLAVVRALESGWVAPAGPELTAFEHELCAYVNVGSAVALSSGTAALHLGLKGLGVLPGDVVVVPTLTFGATAFPVEYLGARSVFCDVDRDSWALDPQVLRDCLRDMRNRGVGIGAVIVVDLFGRPADYGQLVHISREFEVPILGDSAESLGAVWGGRPVGGLVDASVFSFNGNKIMTTSGGGMLVSDDERLIEKARFWATQSREPYPWYEHEEIGFNYRMSNILAALGRAQLARLPEMIERRRQIRALYTEALSDLEGVVVTPDPPWGTGNSWLTTVTFDRDLRPGAPEKVRLALEAENVESRPIWKPMHQQPVFRNHEAHLTGAADRIFEEGLCLPSGAGLSDGDIERVVRGVRAALA